MAKKERKKNVFQVIGNCKGRTRRYEGSAWTQRKKRINGAKRKSGSRYPTA